MNDCGEQELRERFERLRREDAAGGPSFRATLAGAGRRRARRGPSVHRVAAAAIAVATVVVAAVILDLRLGPRDPRVDLAATRWRGPTDFLLRLPGADYLRTVPRLDAGAFTDWRNP
ncbi:MAG TPA: hypothetical protein VFU41_15775 [Gemmatimonadales bacterium]|nr:hypothetical protein [Gemmatimonadales bacterium]